MVSLPFPLVYFKTSNYSNSLINDISILESITNEMELFFGDFLANKDNVALISCEGDTHVNAYETRCRNENDIYQTNTYDQSKNNKNSFMTIPRPSR